MRVHAREVEVFVAGHSPGNVYHPGEKAPLDMGLYCETVTGNGGPPLVFAALCVHPVVIPHSAAGTTRCACCIVAMQTAIEVTPGQPPAGSRRQGRTRTKSDALKAIPSYVRPVSTASTLPGGRRQAAGDRPPVRGAPREEHLLGGPRPVHPGADRRPRR